MDGSHSKWTSIFFSNLKYFSQSETTKGLAREKVFLTKLHKMTGKKKTVKDLNVDVINLAVKFKHFEEIMSEIAVLKEFKDLDKKLEALNRNGENEKKITDLEEEVKRLHSVVNDLKRKEKEEDVPNPEKDCNLCKAKFNSMKELKAHRKSEHTKQIKCKYCDNMFDENYKLENHLK